MIIITERIYPLHEAESNAETADPRSAMLTRFRAV